MKPNELTKLDPILMDRARLAIITTVFASSEPVEFNSLLDTLDLTKGNLSSHIRKLEDASYLKVNREFVNRKPRTTYQCTKLGEKMLRNYLSIMEKVLNDALKA